MPEVAVLAACRHQSRRVAMYDTKLPGGAPLAQHQDCGSPPLGRRHATLEFATSGCGPLRCQSGPGWGHSSKERESASLTSGCVALPLCLRLSHNTRRPDRRCDAAKHTHMHVPQQRGRQGKKKSVKVKPTRAVQSAKEVNAWLPGKSLPSLPPRPAAPKATSRGGEGSISIVQRWGWAGTVAWTPHAGVRHMLTPRGGTPDRQSPATGSRYDRLCRVTRPHRGGPRPRHLHVPHTPRRTSQHHCSPPAGAPQHRRRREHASAAFHRGRQSWWLSQPAAPHCVVVLPHN